MGPPGRAITKGQPHNSNDSKNRSRKDCQDSTATEKKTLVSDLDRIDFALLDPGPRIFFENVDQDLDPGSKETD